MESRLVSPISKYNIILPPFRNNCRGGSDQVKTSEITKLTPRFEIARAVVFLRCSSFPAGCLRRSNQSPIPSLVALPRRDQKLPHRRPPFPTGCLLRRSSRSFPVGRRSLVGRLPPLQSRARGQPPLLLAAPFCSFGCSSMISTSSLNWSQGCCAPASATTSIAPFLSSS